VHAGAFDEAGWGGAVRAAVTGRHPVGLIAVGDPIRAVAATVAEAFEKAGIRLILITGDHPATAAAIGGKLGIWRTGDAVVRGDTRELADAEPARVYARILPEQKPDIIAALQRALAVRAWLLRGGPSNPALLAAVALSAALQIAAVAWAPLRALLSTQPLILTQLAACAAVATLPGGALAVTRALNRRQPRPGPPAVMPAPNAEAECRGPTGGGSAASHIITAAMVAAAEGRNHHQRGTCRTLHRGGRTPRHRWPVDDVPASRPARGLRLA
jgi:hypothetical protein